MARKKEVPLSRSAIHFEPRTDSQAEAIEVVRNHDLVFLTGPAGSSKTHTAVAAAIQEMMELNVGKRTQIQKLIITRPIVEAGEKLGSLPGDIAEKCHPYMLPIYNCITKIVTNGQKWIQDNVLLSPLAYLRGTTFDYSIAILDEAQNCTISQLLLFMTRLGNGGKIIVTGDSDQSDIGHYSGLQPWVNALRGKRGVGMYEFTESDIVRHPLVKTILQNRPKTK